MTRITGEKRILKSVIEPPNTNWLWLKTTDGIPTIYEYIDGSWVPLASAKTEEVENIPVNLDSFGIVSYDKNTHRINFYAPDDIMQIRVLGYISTVPFESNPNTVDAEARQLIEQLLSAINNVINGNITTAIETFQEVISFLNGVTDDTTLIGKLNELRTMINQNAATMVKSITINGQSPASTPDQNGNINIVVQAGDVVSVSTNEDGTFTIHAGSNDYTINLNHEHDGYAQKSEMAVSTSGDQTTITLKNGTNATVINQHQSLAGYAKYVVLADEAAYTALANKDSSTLYLIPES